MIGTLLLALTIAQAAPEPPRASGIRFVARTAYADGRVEYRDITTIVNPMAGQFGRHTFYVSVPSTACDALLVSDHPAADAAYAWRIHMAPVKYAPQARVVTRAEVLLSAQRTAGATPEPKIAALPTQNAKRTVEVDGVTGLRPIDGCTAVAFTIEARLLPEPAEVRATSAARPPLMEGEFWFVHKAPDGKETTQRQVVRMRDGGRGDFYFDDLNLTVGTGSWTVPIAVEVFGTIDTGTMMSDGDINMTLRLTRRYVNKGTALGNWPKTGSTDYPITVKAGEVVSFLLPPLKDDDGILLGHRFSLRLRLTPRRSSEF